MDAFDPAQLDVTFTDATQAEGQRLMADGDVQLLEDRGTGTFEARVRFFRRHHEVWIARNRKGAWESECSCPWRENEGTGCAHLWGLVLAIQARSAEDAGGETRVIQPVWHLLRDPKRFALACAWTGPTGDGDLRPMPLDGDHLVRIEDPRDERVIALLAPAAEGRRNRYDGGGLGRPLGPWTLPPEGREDLLRALAETQRFFLAPETSGDALPLRLDWDQPFELTLSFRRQSETGRLRLEGVLARAEETVTTTDLLALAADRSPVAVLGERIIRIEAFGAEEWLRLFARGREFPVGEGESREVVARLAKAGPLPRVALEPDGEPLPLDVGPPTPVLHIRNQQRVLAMDLVFRYGDQILAPESGARLALDLSRGCQIRRDLDDEADVLRWIPTIRGITADDGVFGRWFVAPAHLDHAVITLLERGAEVSADSRRYRRAQTPFFHVTSGIDWLSLEGGARFADENVALGTLLLARQRGQRFVELSDGSAGLLPTEWLDQVAAVLPADSAGAEGPIRVHRARAPLIAELLDDAGEPVPAELSSVVSSLGDLLTVPNAETPSGFHGVLRPYQGKGVAWMRGLAALGLGGCLADDMGLGKTIQVLAFLRSLEEGPIGSITGERVLIVAPRSLLWNWTAEAKRFVPDARWTVHHGPNRAREIAQLPTGWLITTYGTLQRDTWLAEVPFDAVVLDEAHAIKNPESRNAQSAKGLTARVRISLTGTPVENHPRDLWSQMEFLNPGLLGSEKRFLETTSGTADPAVRASVARALRPFVLRRKKGEVAQELPPLIEQTLLVGMSEQQEQLYEQIREAGIQALSQRGNGDGTPAAILETLLRLRQVACHPSLVNPALQESAKIDLLVDEVQQVVDSGHKALVFSQFVQLLDLVDPRLKEAGVPTLRLDGRTRDRGEVVQRFQGDSGPCALLISLRAGGLGLNLTAAEYVYILDPWWNPAVESQAMDRTHRIGQTRQVFAYRLVARGTVEERILDLQQTKRQMAEALLEDGAGPTPLTLDDLRQLITA